MLSETWRCKGKGKKNHNSDTILKCSSCRYWWSGYFMSKAQASFFPTQFRGSKMVKNGKVLWVWTMGLSPHCWGAQTGAGCPRWGHHAGWFLPVEEQNDLSQTYLLSTGCSACFTQKLLRRLCWGEGSLPSHGQDPGLTPGGWGTAALVTGTGQAGVTARPFLSQHLSATNEFSPKSA